MANRISFLESLVQSIFISSRVSHCLGTDKNPDRMESSFQWREETDNKQENTSVRLMEILVKVMKSRNQDNGEI